MDIQVVYLQDILPVFSVTNVSGVVPRTLDIRGKDFRSAVKVEINEEESPSFAVMSKNRILAQVPENQEKEIVRVISVISSGFTRTDRSKLSLELTNNPQKVSGLQKLVQTFVLYLLRTPGSDVWYPNSGGGVLQLVGSTFSRSNTGAVTASFTTSVSRVKTQIMTLQARKSQMDPREKLAAANVLSAVFSVNQTALLARVELINQAGESALVGLEM